MPHLANSQGQPGHPIGQLGVVKIGVVERGIDIQQRRGHLHCQRGRRRTGAGRGLAGSGLQTSAEQSAVGVQALQRITHQREMLGQTGQARELATGDVGPDLLAGVDALARLRHQCGVETAQSRGLVVNDLDVSQLVDPAHIGQTRADDAARLGRNLGAKKQQILRQAVRGVDLGVDRMQLRQQSRRNPFAVQVQARQAHRLGLKEGRRQLPQRRKVGVARALSAHARAQRREQAAQSRCRDRRAATHQRQQFGLGLVDHGGIDLARADAGVVGQVAPLPVQRPQVSWVHPGGACQLLQGLVLREHGQRRYRLAGQQAAQIVEQRKGGPLQCLYRRRGDQLGPCAQAQQRRLAGPQQVGRRAHADQFEHAHALVKLHPRLAQHRRIDRVQLRGLGRQGLFQVLAQRLGRNFERLAQLVVHPGQGAEIIAGMADRASTHDGTAGDDDGVLVRRGHGPRCHSVRRS